MCTENCPNEEYLTKEQLDRLLSELKETTIVQSEQIGTPDYYI